MTALIKAEATSLQYLEEQDFTKVRPPSSVFLIPTLAITGKRP
jgi:hypothetical protein